MFAAHSRTAEPVAEKFIALERAKKSEPAVSLEEHRNRSAMARVLAELMPRPEQYTDSFPLSFSIYMDAMNQLWAFAQQIRQVPPLNTIGDFDDAMEGLHCISSGDALIGQAFHDCAVYFDRVVGEAQESLASVTLAMFREWKVSPDLVHVLSSMEWSRMGLYYYEGEKEGRVLLRDFLSGELFEAVNPLGHEAQQNELWFTRLLPPIEGFFDEYVVFVDPYVIEADEENAWREYFGRVLPPETSPAHGSA
ncbi:hypothetical protein KKF84_08330, partial [Myxococcota bacterium]|nr:hypothetical protein [Myxococcota bacterium]MBU1535315.1 hypothetical protein [Myxococcota bacterium]